VAAHVDTLHEARKDAAYWTKTTTSPLEIQERFPSGAWVTVETVKRGATSATKPHSSRPAKKASHATKKTRHATKAKPAKTGTSDKINIAQLATLFGLPDWDRVDDMNQDTYWEMARGAEDTEEAERAAQEEVYNKWYDAVESAASKLFEEHGLELSPTGKQGTEKRSYDLKIVPSKSWDDAANKIRETINGVGDFHFNDLREFLRSGPYTAKQAVISHLGYIKRYPAVYGGLGANQMYEHAWR
jgi:hypothetical protein